MTMETPKNHRWDILFVSCHVIGVSASFYHPWLLGPKLQELPVCKNMGCYPLTVHECYPHYDIILHFVLVFFFSVEAYIKSHNGLFVLSKSPLNLQKLLLRTCELYTLPLKSQSISLEYHSILFNKIPIIRMPHGIFIYLHDWVIFQGKGWDSHSSTMEGMGG